MERTSEQRLSALFTVARVFALISIVSAHITFTVNVFGWVARLYKIVASVGVVCFLFISGYYYKPEKFGSFTGLLKKKGLTIGLPWLFLGSVSFLYNYILSGGDSFVLEYLKWIIGNGTYLYYLTVLFICFLAFYKTNDRIQIGAMLLTVVSLLLTALGVFDSVISFLHITNYLNVFNWFGIFAAGMYVRNKIATDKLYGFLKKSRWIILGLFIAVAILLIIFDQVQVGYFSYVGIWLEILGTLAIFSIATLEIFENKIFEDLANLSFTVYLIHLMVIGVFDFVFNLHFITQILATGIIIVICYVGLAFVRWLIKIVKLEKIGYPLFGFRERELEKEIK